MPGILQLTGAMKTAIVKGLLDNKIQHHEVRKTLNLSKNTIRRWKTRYRSLQQAGAENPELHESHGGRPATIDSVGAEEYIAEVRAAQRSNNVQRASPEEKRQIFEKHQRNTLKMVLSARTFGWSSTVRRVR